MQSKKMIIESSKENNKENHGENKEPRAFKQKSKGKYSTQKTHNEIAIKQTVKIFIVI